jgi:hypothetical protein
MDVSECSNSETEPRGLAKSIVSQTVFRGTLGYRKKIPLQYYDMTPESRYSGAKVDVHC